MKIFAALVILLLLGACGPSDSDFNEFSTYKSPDGRYFVIIDAARSKLAFGAETIRISVVEADDRDRREILRTKIANDGGGVGHANVKAHWVSPGVVRFCLSGDEQEDVVLEIDLKALSYFETTENCA